MSSSQSSSNLGSTGPLSPLGRRNPSGAIVKRQKASSSSNLSKASNVGLFMYSSGPDTRYTFKTINGNVPTYPRGLLNMAQAMEQAPTAPIRPSALLSSRSWLPEASTSTQSSALRFTSLETLPTFSTRPSTPYVPPPPKATEPVKRDQAIGRSAKANTGEGTFVIPIPRIGSAYRRTLVMGSIPPRWTLRQVVTWALRHGPLLYCALDPGSRRAVLFYEWEFHATKAYMDAPVYLFPDIFLCYWRPAESTVAASITPDEYRSMRESLQEYPATSEWLVPAHETPREDEEMADVQLVISESAAETISTSSSGHGAPVLSNNSVMQTDHQAPGPAPIATPSPSSTPVSTSSAEPSTSIATPPVLSPADIKAKEERLSDHINETKYFMMRYAELETQEEKRMILKILRQRKMEFEETEKAIASGTLVLPPPRVVQRGGPKSVVRPQRGIHSLGMFAGRRLPDSPVCIGPIDISDSEEDEDEDDDDE